MCKNFKDDEPLKNTTLLSDVAFYYKQEIRAIRPVEQPKILHTLKLKVSMNTTYQIGPLDGEWNSNGKSDQHSEIWALRSEVRHVKPK
jgi:hypothetical protein